jgi:hypothetical protein
MDCFVFPRAWIDSFLRTEAVTGVGGVMRSLLYNLVAKADHLLFLCSAHLTLHYGDDRSWRASHFVPALAHNGKEARDLWLRLIKQGYEGRLAELASKIPRFAPKG